jgi:hypothetical protein
MIGDVRIALAVAAKRRDFELEWRPASPAFKVRPDGFFTLRFRNLPEGGNRAHFFLEADRSTMPRDRMVAKFVAYKHAWLTGAQTTVFGIKEFRVLTVTRSEERLTSLRTAAAVAQQALGDWSGRLWFTSITRFTIADPASIVLAVWDTPIVPRQQLLP